MPSSVTASSLDVQVASLDVQVASLAVLATSLVVQAGPLADLAASSSADRVAALDFRTSQLGPFERFVTFYLYQI